MSRWEVIEVPSKPGKAPRYALQKGRKLATTQAGGTRYWMDRGAAEAVARKLNGEAPDRPGPVIHWVKPRYKRDADDFDLIERDEP